MTGGKASMGGFERSRGKGFKCSTLEEQVCLVAGGRTVGHWGRMERKGDGGNERV